MGKKSRQKKNKYKDFQKVKLKVGKTLPRGLNETVATFKSKGILIKEQLKAERDIAEPTTKRKLNITDLLSQCQHYSTSVRHDAVMGIRELLSQNIMILQKHTGQIIERCSELFLDKDSVVRSTVHKMLRAVLCKLTSSQMSAFFPILSAHLCCAMTHIDDDIQQDSLEVLDLCIDFFPALVVNNSSQIMSNFVEQISRQSQTSSKGTVQQRSLLVNPSSKLSSQKWRNKVLQRLKKFFEAFLEHECEKRSWSTLRDKADFLWSEKRKISSQLLKSSLSMGNENQLFLLRNLEQNVSTDQSIKSFIEVLVPLLMQCWVEASPSQLATDLAGNALGAAAMTTLWNVLNVLQLQMKVIEHHNGSTINFEWFAERYLNDLVQYFMPYFPYSMHQQSHKGKHSGGKGTASHVGPTVSVRTLNLAVCKVMSYFIHQTPVGTQWREQVLDYMTESPERTKINEEQVALMVGIIDNVIYSTTDEDTINSMLEVAYEVLNSRQQATSVEMRNLLKFLNYFAFSKDGLRNNKYEVLLKWVGSLPVLTWKAFKMTDKLDALNELLYYLKSAGPYRTEKYMTNVKKLLFEHIFVKDNKSLHKLPLGNQKRLTELIYWIPTLTRSEYQAITDFFQDNETSLNVVYHTLEIMTIRMAQAEDTTTEISYFLSSLLSLILGKTEKSQENSMVQNDLFGGNVFVDNICMDDKATERRISIIQQGSKILTYFPEHYNIPEIMETYLQKYIMTEASLKGLPLLKAVGLFNVLAAITDTSKLDSEEEFQIFGFVKTNSIHERQNCNEPLCDILGSVLCLLLDTNAESASSHKVDPVQTENSQTADGHQNGEEMMDISVFSWSKAKKILLWDVVIITLLKLTNYWKLFIRRSCNKLQSITDVEQIKLFILILTKLLNCVQLQDILRTESIAIKNMMLKVETNTKLTDQWWIAFKYEVSLLR